MANDLLDKTVIDDHIRKYISDMNAYNSKDKDSLSELLKSSRIVSALLVSKLDDLNLKPF